MAGIRRFNTLDEGEEFLMGMPERHESALCLFFGTEDAQTGESWCPDCVIACPVARRLCRTLRPELPLYEFSVGTVMEWKHARFVHPYRGNPLLRVQRIPTLLRFRDGAVVGRLVEADCADEAKLREFLSEP